MKGCETDCNLPISKSPAHSNAYFPAWTRLRFTQKPPRDKPVLWGHMNRKDLITLLIISIPSLPHHRLSCV